MGQPSEFSLESVRQLMLASGGRVTNHDLVKCFRAWLTDPVGKEAARAQFKDYVNTLATIRQENGEKFLILKKKFYPEYYAGTSYLDTVTPSGYAGPGFQDSPNMPGLPGEGTNYGEVQTTRRREPSSFYPEPPLPNRASPSMLDEVMAGFAPPSRSMSRQLPALPNSPPFPTPTYSSPTSYTTQPPYSSQNSYSTQSSYDSSQQAYAPPKSSHGLPQPSYPAQASYSALPSQSSHTALPGSQGSYQGGYGSQQPAGYGQNGGSSQHHTVGLPSGPHSLGLPVPQVQRRETNYQRQASVESIRGPRSEEVGYREGYREVEESMGYNSGFNPHMKHSVEPLQASQPGYLGGYPEVSGLPGQRLSTASLASSTPSYQSSSTSRLGQGVPPPPAAFASPPGSSYSPSPRSSYAALPPHPGLPPPAARPPPPYRAPPPDPVQSRPLPSRPSASALTSPPPAPPKRSATGTTNNVPPQLPPVAISSSPPPLPRRHPSDVGSAPPRDRSNSQEHPSGGSTRISESQQPSPTDSGFTEDSKSFAEPLQGRSKSYGNLTAEREDEVLTQAASLDQLQLDSLPSSASLDDAQAISVKERTKTFNRLASQTSVLCEELPPTTAGSSMQRLPSAVKRRNSRAVDMFTRRGSQTRQGGDGDEDCASITTIDPHVKQWMVAVSRGDYQSAAKMLIDDPKLSRHRDFTCGYTGLHWACKHGNIDMVKLLAGTYQASTSVRTHGGYTPLHIAAQHNHQEVFDLLVGAYKADANVRDYAGKKPRQYMMVQGAEGLSLSMSNDTFRTLKDRRKHRTSRMEKNPSILRFGSLSVKVKKTTEAFNNYFGNGSEPKVKWENNNGDKEKMPPPRFAPVKKRSHSKRTIDFGRTKSAPVTPVERSPVKEVIVEEREELGSDSDSEYGFGDRWGGEANTSKAWGPLAKSSAKKNSQRRGKSRKKRVGVSTVRKGEEVSCQ